MKYGECIVKWGDYWSKCPDCKKILLKYSCDYFVESRTEKNVGYCELKPKSYLEDDLFQI